MGKTHLDHLIDVIPNLRACRILDIGAGRGAFLIDCAKRGIHASGIEYHRENIKTAHARAEEAGVPIDLVPGNAEMMPYADETFGFANLSELIEHVRDPRAVLAEVFRVLAPGGFAYVSVPSRFSFYDTHFHIPFVNWLPRAWADVYIALWGRHKNYHKSAEADLHRLIDMHYYTFSGAVRLFSDAGFTVEDLRVAKIRSRFSNVALRQVVLFAYRLLRPWHFRAFHFLIRKPL